MIRIAPSDILVLPLKSQAKIITGQVRRSNLDQLAKLGYMSLSLLAGGPCPASRKSFNSLEMHIP
jgi:hypothetical protein